jgi:hypothetical protein
MGLAKLNDDERNVVRQVYAGLLWSKQFYHYIVQDWLNGDPEKSPESANRVAISSGSISIIAT